MLKHHTDTGDRNVSGIFVSKGERLQVQANEVYCTDDSETLRMLERQHCPCIYLEHSGNIPDYQADFVWQGEGMPDQDYLELVWRRYHRLPLIIAETPQLIVRESVTEDGKIFQKMYEEEKENPDVQIPKEDMTELLDSYIKVRYPLYGYGLWTVEEKQSKMVIGRAGVEEMEEPDGKEVLQGIELSYLFLRAYRNHGYAVQCCRAILSYLEENSDISEIFLRTSKENKASRRVAQKLGFQKLKTIGRYRKILYIRSIDR